MTEIEGQITRLEGIINKATQMMRRISQDEGDDEKVDLLVKEIQTMKTQMFFLQQSILQMRTQEHLALEVRPIFCTETYWKKSFCDENLIFIFVYFLPKAPTFVRIFRKIFISI